MPLKIIATPVAGLDAVNALAADQYNRIAAAVAGRGFIHVPNWRTIDELFTKVQAEVTARNDCLSVLEIYAHGNPTICDGIKLTDATTFGAKLKAMKTASQLCDQLSVYFAGCNTAVRYQNADSLAQAVSRQTPTLAVDNVKVTVFGSVGYLAGTFTENNETCTPDVTFQGHYYAKYPKTPDGTRVWEGSKSGTGRACWRGFSEGNLVP